MASDIHSAFSCNFKHILTDEIALNGLEGIGLGSLWSHVENRISSPLTAKMKARFWKTVVNCEDISFYQNPVTVPTVKVLDRFAIVDQKSGYLLEPEDYLDGDYEYHPVQEQYGSCVYFNERIPQSRETLKGTSYEKIEGTDYGNRLVMVASLEERWKALAEHKPISFLNKLSPLHYCIMELIGKGRENGQVTAGKTNLVKIVKDPKFMFYNRNFLQKHDLIGSQNVSNKSDGKHRTNILLMIKRFYKPNALCLPKVGMIRNVVDHLVEQPGYTDQFYSLIDKGLITKPDCKPLLKRTIAIFDFEDRLGPPLPSNSKKAKQNLLKTKYITFTCPSDQESNDSEDEMDDLPCRYKVGIGLMRQAFELVVEAGQKGVSQLEIGHLLGIEFYTARAICVILRRSKICKETIEDRGRQRTSRFVMKNANTGVDEYETEKKKLLDYMSQDVSQNMSLNDTKLLDDAVNTVKTEPNPFDDTKNTPASKRRGSNIDSDIPEKKKKMTKQPALFNHTEEMDTIVEDVKILDGLETVSPKLFKTDQLSLRQLRFMNGIIKVLREQKAVSGFCTLSSLVAKEINEPPIDSKRLKIFLQKLLRDGQIKVLKMKWPGDKPRHTYFLCAPQLQPNDPIIVTKYKELCLRLMRFKSQIDKVNNKPKYPVFLHIYPRYMRIQKMHELITKMVYFERDETELASSNIPEGFAAPVYIIPEMTIEAILSNMTQLERLDVLRKNIDNKYYDVKLKEVPPEISSLLANAPGVLENVRANLRILAILGLIQLIKENTQVGDNIVMSYAFYVNRNANILDTTGTWPRSCNLKDIEKSYHFETFKDVEAYWQDVYNISTNTDVQVAKEVRQRKTITAELYFRSEVEANDTGKQFGNGLGPCGFDATLFMDAPRFWSSFYCKVKKKNQQEPNKSKSKKKGFPANKEPVMNTKRTTRGPRRIRKPKLPKVKPPKSKKIQRKSIKWSPIEDKMVMLAKAAITILSPVSQPGSLRLRNIVTKDVLLLSDPKKVAATCHLRAQTVEYNSNLVYEKECLINEVRHTESLRKKYDGLFKKLKTKYPNSLSRSIQEARVPMMELMMILYEISKSESFNKRMPGVSLSYDDFNAKYTICPASANTALNLYHTPSELGPGMAALKEAMVLTVLLSYQFDHPPELAKKIFEMFENYTEMTLRAAIEPLRKCGAVAARDKTMNTIHDKAYLEDICQSHYRVAACYQRKWITRFTSDFMEKLASLLDASVESPESGLKGYPELNCFLNEMQCKNVLEITAVTPPFVDAPTDSMLADPLADILEKDNLKAGTCGWKLKVNTKRFSNLYEDVQVMEALQTLARNSIIDSNVLQQQDSSLILQELDIVTLLRVKKGSGITFPDLQILTGFDSKILQNKLQVLESGNIIKRIGYNENFIILTEFVQDWTVTFDSARIVPVPWLQLDNDKIRMDIFLNWTTIILDSIYKHPGCSIKFLSDKCEFLTARSVQDLCTALEIFGCVTLNVLKDTTPDWCSEDETIPQIEDFNPYELVENIAVYPVKDSLTRFSYVRRKLLEKQLKQ